ncbi:hypothetical protein HMPREF1321_2290 [Capnocytophaga sp. oral taxon 412 str. F0487]|nr:hypothetical protein HMPREF1321_2290 [Capnocytophaga sp. oral taxon 412 str. F0487]
MRAAQERKIREFGNEGISKWGASYKKSTSGGFVSLFNFAKV